MALFSRNKQPQGNVIQTISDSFMAWISGQSSTAPVQTNESALENAAVNCAVKTISEAVASVPIDLKKITYKNGLKYTTYDEKHWAAKLINRPNSFMTRMEFFETMTAHMMLGKGALLIKVQVGSEVRELLPVQPNVWTLEILDDGSHRFRVNMANGNQQIFLPEQVVYLHGMGIDGYSGVSAIQKARTAIGISSTLEKQSISIAANGGRPAGILTFENELTPEKRKLLKEQWQASYSNGASGTAILDGGARYLPMTMSHTDAQFLESRQHQVAEIARIFKIPTPMLFNGEAITPETLRYFNIHCVKPYFVRWEEALKRDLLKDHPDYFFDFADEELLRASPAEQANYFKQALGAGGSMAWLALNDVRAALYMDPIDEDWAKVPSRGGYELAGASDDQISNEVGKRLKQGKQEQPAKDQDDADGQ